MKKRIVIWLAAGLVASVIPAVASADVIGLPENSGVGTPGMLDPGFILTGAPAGVATGAMILDPALLPDLWALGTTAGWIGVNDDAAMLGAPSDPVGIYDYTVEFEITGDASSVAIKGTWATDNAAQIFVNGMPTQWTTNIGGFLELSPFLLTGFQTGPNTITFSVLNIPWPNTQVTGNPTGLMVQQLVVDTPEPTTLVLLGIGLCGLALLRRRRRIDPEPAHARDDDLRPPR